MAAEHVTELLAQWRDGAPAADERLFAAVYGELRKLARAHVRRERAGHTLEPTALVNEAYLRLVSQRSVHWEGRGHFFRMAARIMRRVLVDHARRRAAARRNAGHRDAVSVSRMAIADAPEPIDVLAVHTALDDLAILDARQAAMVELRYFAGLTHEEIGAIHEVSVATVKRELATAKLWLRQRMG